MMNDATLRQMAAAKTTVNNENHMLRASSAGFILPSAARQLKRLSSFHKRAPRCKQCDKRKQSEDAQIRLPMATDAERKVNLRYIVPADGISAANSRKRRLRYVSVLWAALGQATACLCRQWGAGPKAQWLVEN